MKSSKVEFSREELIDLFSTSTYGCEWMDIHTLKSEKWIDDKLDKEYLEGRCREERWADRLLGGGHIVAIDYYPAIEDDEPEERYQMDWDEFCTRAAKCLEECPKNLSNLKGGNFDYYDANNVMQVIMFGEIVYG